MRILNAEPKNYSSEARALLESMGQLTEKECTRLELIEAIKYVHVLIIRLAHQVDKEVMDAAQNLKVIVTATTGLNHIDIEYAASKGIEVLSLKDEVGFLKSIPATAELTWSLLLSLSRNIPQAAQSVLDGDWDRDSFIGRDLCGKRLGVLGYGRVGKMVAGFALAFGMEVHAYDIKEFSSPKGIYKETSLSGLLNVSDVLSLHIPLDSSTLGLIGEAELNLLPEGAIVLNTSRGEILDSNALIVGLKRGLLRGAGLDVVSGERDENCQSKLELVSYAKKHNHLIITPHIGGATKESMEKTEIFMANKLGAYVQNLSQGALN